MLSQLVSSFSTAATLFGRLDGKVCLVTGAAMGIGKATADTFHREGATVIYSDILEKPEITEQIEQLNQKRDNSAVFIKMDVTKEDQWKNTMEQIKEKFGKLDVTVNNAGILDMDHVEKETLKGFKRVEAVNIESVFLGCKHSIKLMKEQKKGSIINLSSILGLVGDPGLKKTILF